MKVEQYFREPRLPHMSVKEIAERRNHHYITLGDLAKLVAALSDKCSEDTLVAFERLPDSLFTDGSTGWKVINCRWDRYIKGEIAHDSFCDAVPIFNFFLTEDANGDSIILGTPHY